MDFIKNVFQDQPVIYQIFFAKDGSVISQSSPTAAARPAPQRPKAIKPAKRPQKSQGTPQDRKISGSHRKISNRGKPQNRISPPASSTHEKIAEISSTHHGNSFSEIQRGQNIEPETQQHQDKVEPQQQHQNSDAAAEKILERSFFEAVMQGSAFFEFSKTTFSISFQFNDFVYEANESRAPFSSSFRSLSPSLLAAFNFHSYRIFEGKHNLLKTILQRNSGLDVNMSKSELDRRRFSRGGSTLPKNTLGWKAIHFAAWFNDLPTAQILLDHGADPTLVSLRAQTPLHVAVRNDSYEVAQILIDYVALRGEEAKKRYIGTNCSPRLA